MDKQTINILENIIEGFIAIDRWWCSTYLNYAAEVMMHKEREDVLGKSIYEVFSPTMGHIFIEKCHEAVETRTVVDFETFASYLQKWFHVRCQPDEEGLQIYFQDITAYKLLQQQVDETLALVAESSPVGFAFFDTSLRYRRVNRILADLNGISPQEHIGKTVLEVFPAIASQATRALQKVIVTGETVTLEMLASPPYAPDLKQYCLVRFFPVYVPSGELLGVGAFVLDITEFKLAEEARRESEAHLRRLLESNVIGIAVCNEMFIFDANDAFLTMIGYTRQDMLEGKLTYTALVPPEYANEDRQRWKELIERGAYPSFEKVYLRKDGSRVPVLIGSALLQKHPPLWINFILDLSERKELEQRKDAFIGLASHELRTPLTTIKGLTQLLQRKLEHEGRYDYVKLLAKMDEQVKRMSHLISDFLDVPKMQTGTLAFTDELLEIDPLIQQCVETVQQTTTTHTLLLQGASGKSLRGDRERLEQAFINLMNNAIKYSPQEQVLNVSIIASDKAVSVSVQDFGVGIPQALQDKIFDLFYRVTPTNNQTIPGMGLGLYFTSQIIQHHGGRITVESAEGKGSTFIVSLPLPSPHE